MARELAVPGWCEVWEEKGGESRQAGQGRQQTGLAAAAAAAAAGEDRAGGGRVNLWELVGSRLQQLLQHSGRGGRP